MGTTREDIRGWLERAKAQGASHMLVVCDTFDHDDYPVNVIPPHKARDVFADYNSKSMQRVMECYDLSLDIEKQLLTDRVFNF